MRKLLVALVVALSMIPLGVQAEEAPCASGLIHYLPYCLTQAEYDALIAPTPTLPEPELDSVERWRPMVAYYWPAWAVDRMMRIMVCETVPDGNEFSLNPSSGAAGLFQIMPGWKKVWAGDYFDPWINAATAYQIWLVQGFGAWNASRPCWG